MDSKVFPLKPQLFLIPFLPQSHLNFWLLVLLTNSSPKLTPRCLAGVLKKQPFPLKQILPHRQQFPGKDSTQVVVSTALYKQTCYGLALQCLDLNGFLDFPSCCILSTHTSVLHGFASDYFSGSVIPTSRHPSLHLYPHSNKF